MSCKLLAVMAVLLATAALAQPFASAPTMSRYNYIQPKSSMSQTAVVGVVRTYGWAFTATSDGVYGMNVTLPSYDTTNVQFYDWLPGVTQMFATGPWTLVAIANSSIVLYEHNMTTAWRAATYKRDDMSFDVQQAGSTGTSYLYPLVYETTLVIGSRNLMATGANPWSMVFAFNSTTLALLWNTTIMFDTTAYAPSSYYGDSFVFVLAQNTYATSSNFRVYKLWLNNGTIVGSALNTQNSYFTTIGVTDAQLVVSSRYYIDIYDMSWTKLRNTVSTNYAYNMLYQPVAVNGTWYVLMDQQLYAFDYATSAQTSWSPKVFSNSVYGASMRFINESMTTGMIQSNLLMMEGCNVWVVNSSGLVKMMQLQSQSTSCNPVAAVFDHDWRHENGFINNIAHLSYRSGNGGTVISIDYRNGYVLAQATGNFNPVGQAQIDLWARRLYSASTTGGIIQGFAFNPRMSSNYTDFASQIPTTEDQTSNFGFAYNASNSSSYYITEDNLFTIDYMGNVAKVASIPNTVYYVYNNPLIVGQYFVFTGTYAGSYYLYAYNSVSKTLASLSVCSLSSSHAMFSVGTVVYGVCDSSSRAAISVDVSKTTLAVVNFGTYYGYGVSADAKHVVVRMSDSLILSAVATPSTAIWTKSLTNLVTYSAPVLYGDNVFIVGYVPGIGDTSTYLLKIAVGGGGITKVGKLYSGSTYTIQIMQNGVFGSAGYVYCLGTQNVTAFNMGSNELVFSYAINTTMYGSLVRNMLTPTVLSNGAIAFYTSNSYLQVVGGFKGGLAWSYAGASTTNFPIMTDGKSVYFVRNNQVVGADTYTGAVTSVSAFGTNTLFGYSIAAGVNETTVVGANGYMVFAATTPLYESPAGSNPSFPGQGGSSNGGGLLEEAKSKAWIAGVVIGVLVVIVIVVVIAKKRSEAKSTFDDDYVPMNPSTQV